MTSSDPAQNLGHFWVRGCCNKCIPCSGAWCRGVPTNTRSVFLVFMVPWLRARCTSIHLYEGAGYDTPHQPLQDLVPDLDRYADTLDMHAAEVCQPLRSWLCTCLYVLSEVLLSDERCLCSCYSLLLPRSSLCPISPTALLL